MWRTLASLAIVFAAALFVAKYETWLGPWGQMLVPLAAIFVISAIVPGYFYRGDPWPWRPWRRDRSSGDSAPNGSRSA
jgi:hypothetical protein